MVVRVGNKYARKAKYAFTNYLATVARGRTEAGDFELNPAIKWETFALEPEFGDFVARDVMDG